MTPVRRLSARWRRRWLPHPRLTVMVVIVWALLHNGLSAGVLASGIVLGVAIPRLTARFWPERPTLGPSRKVIAYVLLVMWDIVVANVHVARLVLFRPAGSLRSRFICVPLDLRVPEAITVLAGTVTMTPGTVSCDLSADGRCLLVHCLDVGDEAAAVALIKSRYESRLQEIFP